MWKLLNQILGQFNKCFTRKATFNWFVTIVIGFMIRNDTLGVSSVIRDLNLSPNCYSNMMHFFRSDAWNLQTLIKQWMLCVKTHAPVYKEDGMTILVGDGVKQPKEARKMPGVKKMYQESENSSKPEYIFGHLFGAVGALAGNSKKLFCIPLSLKIHDGIKLIRSWDKNETEKGSHVIEMIRDGFDATKIFGKSLLVLDRYFLSVPALETLVQLNKESGQLMHILTKAKSNCVAYTKLIIPEKPKRGRPRKKGDTVKLKELFITESESFTKTTLKIYGKEVEVEYLTKNLLWGQKLYKELHFVLVKYEGINSILVSTKLDLEPTTMIRLYASRFKIECTFRELKQVIGGFSYQFWSKVMPRSKRYAKKGDPDPIKKITSESDKKLILAAVKAIEGYVMISNVAIGLLQILSLKFSGEMTNAKFPIRFLRTQTNEIHSEATVACFLRKSIFYVIEKNKQFAISRIIKSKQLNPLMYEDSIAS